MIWSLATTVKRWRGVASHRLSGYISQSEVWHGVVRLVLGAVVLVQRDGPSRQLGDVRLDRLDLFHHVVDLLTDLCLSRLPRPALLPHLRRYAGLGRLPGAPERGPGGSPRLAAIAPRARPATRASC